MACLIGQISDLCNSAFIPLWIIPSTFGALSAGAFCIQFGVQGAWGVVSNFVLVERPPLKHTIDPNPTGGNVSSRFPCYIPRCCIPNW